MKEKLQAALLSHHPNLKPALAARYVDKYVEGVLYELADQFAHLSSEDISEGEMDFAFDRATKACGAAKAVGLNEMIFGVMQEHPNTSLVIKTYTGNSLTHRVSRVCLNMNYKKEIMDELKSLYIELEPRRLAELAKNANKTVRINPESLASYIEQTRIDLKRIGQTKKYSAAYEAKLVGNLQIANQLVQMAKEDAEGAFVEEYWEQIDSGRTHGHGISLQRIPKEVRHAALGPCYKYDFKAASYALMSSYALSIDPTLKTTAIEEYVRYRSMIRKRIAKDIGVSEEVVKTVFTSVGFGAQLRDNKYTTIRKTLGQEAFHRLLANMEFTLIKKQLDSVSATILSDLGDDDFEMGGFVCSRNDPKTGTKRTKNQRLAWVYQRLETFAMEFFRERIPTACNELLVVHDCVYLDRPIPTKQLVEIKLELRNAFHMLGVEGEKITPIHTADFKGKDVLLAQAAEAEHIARIVAEEKLAQQYAGLLAAKGISQHWLHQEQPLHAVF